MERHTFGAILCAGLGSRMRPITHRLPKPLIPFLNAPLITYALHHLARASITRVGCNLHHLADAIPPIVDRIAPTFGLSPVYAREWELLGTAGGIRGIWYALGEPEGTLVVLNADSVMNLDLSEHLERHHQSAALATLVVRPRSPDQPGRVWLDAGGAMRGLRHHRDPSVSATQTLIEHDFTGVHIIESELLKRLALEPGDIITELYGPMLEAGERIHASVMTGFWAALDTPQLYMQVTRQCMDDPALFEQAPFPEPLRAQLMIYRPGQVDDAAQLASPILTGAHVSIGAQAHVGPHVVLDGVDIAPHATVKNAVLYGMGRVEGDFSDCVAIAGEIASL